MQCSGVPDMFMTLQTWSKWQRSQLKKNDFELKCLQTLGHIPCPDITTG